MFFDGYLKDGFNPILLQAKVPYNITLTKRVSNC